MYNQDELLALIDQEEREAEEASNAQFEGKGFHPYFSTDMDGEVLRCDNCGMNILGEFGKCDDYLDYNRARNAELRAKNAERRAKASL
jgi:hypothetical protein